MKFVKIIYEHNALGSYLFRCIDCGATKITKKPNYDKTDYCKKCVYKHK